MVGDYQKAVVDQEEGTRGIEEGWCVAGVGVGSLLPALGRQGQAGLG